MAKDFSRHIELLRKCDEGREITQAECDELRVLIKEIPEWLSCLQACVDSDTAEHWGALPEAEWVGIGLSPDCPVCTQVEEAVALYVREACRYINDCDASVCFGGETTSRVQLEPDEVETVRSVREIVCRTQALTGHEYVHCEDGIPSNGWVQRYPDLNDVHTMVFVRAIPGFEAQAIEFIEHVEYERQLTGNPPPVIEEDPRG